MLEPARICSLAACFLLVACVAAAEYCPLYSTTYMLPNMAPAERMRRVRGVWQQEQHTQQPLNSSCLEMLRQQAWDMFDHGFTHYMALAFPKDNLLPIKCEGRNWQGGVGLTLVDSLDMLLLLNRRSDVQEALKQLEWAVSFDKDEKVHVFETTIRVLGGLLSGHVLLDADKDIAPGYNGLLLRLATDLGGRLLAAFKTPSGLPGGHVHLQKGIIDTEQVSCTACAGTLLLEFGLLSKLTGNSSFMEAAHHAAQRLFDQRSSLGLVGSGYHVNSKTWSHRDSTIGPGSDSYYEYLLKAYLMFGDRIYLDMFTQLYVATMRHMQVPGQQGASSSAFLLDVHMDSGRLLKPWVSSLGAFWPAMQVLAGQQDDADQLHGNFTAAWATWGWLPELFGADLSAVHPEDPGYNLRPEHIESTWYLKALTGDPTGKYTRLAVSILQVLNHSQTECGYAPIKNVNTGAHTDLMESYFLSETVKYLYLSFVDSAPLLDYYLLSTEGHIMPAYPHADDANIPGLNDTDLSNQDQRGIDGSFSTAGSAATASGRPSGQARSCSSATDAEGRPTVSCTWDSSTADDSASKDEHKQSSVNKPSSAGTLRTDAGDSKGISDSDRTASQPTQAGVCSSSSNAEGQPTITCRWDSSKASSQLPSRNASSSSDSSLLGKPLQQLPVNCRQLCALMPDAYEASLEQRLRAALPLLPVKRISSRRIRYRRCVACVHTTEALAAKPPDSIAVRLARLNHGQGKAEPGSAPPTAANTLPPDVLGQLGTAGGGVVLAQVVCGLKVTGSRGKTMCRTLRRLTALDSAVGLDAGSLILQLTAVLQQHQEVVPTAALLVGFEGLEEEGPVVLELAAAEAAFSPPMSQLSSKCLDYLAQSRVRLAALPMCPLASPHQPPGYLHSNSTWQRHMRTQLRQQQKGGKGLFSAGLISTEGWWLRDASADDPWVGMCPSAHTCWPVLQQAEQDWFATAAAAASDWFTPSRPDTSSNRSSDVSSSSSFSVVGTISTIGVGAQQQDGPQSAEIQVTTAMAPALALAVTERSAAEAHADAEAQPTPALLAGCVGLDASSELGGTWVSPAEFSRPGSGCQKHSISDLPKAAPLVLANPPHACGDYLENAAMIRGAIAVVLRGQCSFLDKAMAVESAGALGLVVVNTQGNRELLTMNGDETGRSPDIPAVLVGGDDGSKLLWWMERRPTVGALTVYDPLEAQASLQEQQKLKAPQQGKETSKQKADTPGSKSEQDKATTKKVAGAPGAAASGSVGNTMLLTTTTAAGLSTHALVQTRVDVFVPSRTHKWLQDNVVRAGGDVNSVYSGVLRDSRVLSALQAAMHSKGKP